MQLILINGLVLEVGGAPVLLPGGGGTQPPPGTFAITSTSLAPLTAGIAYSQTLAAAGGTPPYSWSISDGALPPGLVLSPSGVLSGTVYNESINPFDFGIQASDSTGLSTLQEYEIFVIDNTSIPEMPTVSAVAGNGQITVFTTAAAVGPATTSFTVTSTDGTVTHTFLAASWTFTGLTNGTPYTFAVTANNLVGESNVVLTNTVVPTSGSSTLAITTSSPLPSGLINTPYSTTLAATGGFTPYVWSMISGTLPTGLSLVPTTGVISGTPTQVVTFTGLGFEVTDNSGNSADATFTLVIAASTSGTIPNPVFSASAVAGNGLATISILPDTSGGGATSYTVAVSDGSHANSALTTTRNITGLTNGTPYQFYVTANNATGVSARVYTNTVTPSTGTAALAITTSSLPAGLLNTAYSQTMAATGGTPPYTWALTSGAVANSNGSLPTGLALSSSGVLSGSPTQVCTLTGLVFAATDGAGNTASTTLTIVIQASSIGTIPNPVLSAKAVAGSGAATISISPDTTGAAATSYTISSLDGSVSNAASSTSRTFSNLVNGTAVTFYVTANNATGVSARVYTNTVTPAAVVSSLTLTTSSLSAATVGKAYSAALTATGGTSPYTWSIYSGSLPLGLSLSSSTGVLSGTPTGSNLLTVIAQAGATPLLPVDGGYEATITLADTTDGGNKTAAAVKVVSTGTFAGFQPSCAADGSTISFAGCDTITIDISAASGAQFSMMFFSAGDVPITTSTGDQVSVSFTKTKSGWETFTFAKSSLMTDAVAGDVSGSIYKCSVQLTGIQTGTFLIDNWGGFKSGSVGAGSANLVFKVADAAGGTDISSTITLTVNAS